MPKPTPSQGRCTPSAKPPAKPPAKPSAKPPAGDRVRHVTTGHEGAKQAATGDQWFTWALVRWDRDDGPGMRNKDGLAFVSPSLLEPCTARRVGGRS